MTAVGTTAVPITDTNLKLIQNLGPDDLFVGFEGVTSATGVRVAAEQAISIGATNKPVWVVSSGTSDMRIMGGAMGLHAAEVAP